MSSPNRRQPSSVSGSWRMVDGENDSFETSLAPSLHDDHNEFSPPSSSNPPSSGYPSQLSALSTSQGQHMSLGSQDSIRDFSRHQDDPDNIMREPFRPSLPSARASSNYSGSTTRAQDVELKMPRVDVDTSSPRRSAQRGTASARTTYTSDNLRQRPATNRHNHSSRSHRYDDPREGDDLSPTRRLADSLPSFLLEILIWLLGVVTMAFRYAQRPLALLLAIYVSFGAIIVAQNMVTKSLYVSLSPICRVPGASLLNLPFCPDTPPSGPGEDQSGGIFEFDELMGVQGKLEQVLENSADGVSLPYEMKRSETTIRDLRTLVRTSDIQSRDELVHEFDNYITVARRSAADLQRFNTHCGSAVDSVISINRWTSRYIDSLSPDSIDPSSPNNNDRSALSRWSDWIFHPFIPLDRTFAERMILDKYVEHTALVSDKITALILEAQSVLGLLTRAEDHLGHIHELTTQDAKTASTRRGETLWTLWTLMGANSAALHNYAQQIKLLSKVESQRTDAVRRVSALVLELEGIQIGLEDLRDRVAAPELQSVASAGRGTSSIPLSVHIETIDRGIERLEEARRRIGAAEGDRVKEALRKVGLRDEPLIEGRT